MRTYNMDYTTRDDMIYLTIFPILSSLLCLPLCLSIPSVHYLISSVWTIISYFFLYLIPFDRFLFPLSLLLSPSSVPLSLLLFSYGIYYSLLYFSSHSHFYSVLLLLSFPIPLLYLSLWGLKEL